VQTPRSQALVSDFHLRKGSRNTSVAPTFDFTSINVPVLLKKSQSSVQQKSASTLAFGKGRTAKAEGRKEQPVAISQQGFLIPMSLLEGGGHTLKRHRP
jgi:hypothetical protein